MKKILEKLKYFFLGKNPAGQVLYGVLDILPIPQVHNLIRQAIHKEKYIHPLF